MQNRVDTGAETRGAASLLLAAGADPNLVVAEAGGQTAAHRAAQAGNATLADIYTERAGWLRAMCKHTRNLEICVVRFGPIACVLPRAIDLCCPC